MKHFATCYIHMMHFATCYIYIYINYLLSGS